MDHQEWLALNASEIFQNYFAKELQKEAEEKKSANKYLEDFLKFQTHINANPMLKKGFQQLKDKLADENFKKNVDPGLIEAVMLLDLE